MFKYIYLIHAVKISTEEISMHNDQLQKEKLIKNFQHSIEKKIYNPHDLNFYSLIYVLKISSNSYCRCPQTEGIFIFNTKDKAQNFLLNASLSQQGEITPYMLGDLLIENKDSKSPAIFLINPKRNEKKQDDCLYLFEEFCFAPIFDPITQKFMMTDPSEAISLLSLAKQDLFRLGVEVVFHVITLKSLPSDQEEKESFILNKIRDLQLQVPRTPMKKGSASFYCVLLNLEDPLLERAFIRDYGTFDNYSDVIFVTSSLEIFSGKLESIQYHGENIDRVMLPLIDWQGKRNLKIQ